MFELSYPTLFIIITIILLTAGIFESIKNKEIKINKIIKFLLFYICIVVIVRIVYFPMGHVNGKIDTLKFDSSKVFPFWCNLIPIINLFEVYDGWQINIIGNIMMFIPIGLVWPFCFNKLNTIPKVVLAGAGFSLLIEISQLLFYERNSDIDDLILNTTGALIGALIYFSIKKIKKN